MTGMSIGSAQIFITIFLSMMEGKEYTRAFNNDGNKVLFQQIREDYGDEYYIKALNAAKKHVEYYSTLDKGNLSDISEIIEVCRAQL